MQAVLSSGTAPASAARHVAKIAPAAAKRRVILGLLTLALMGISATASAQCTKYGPPNAPATVTPEKGVGCYTNYVRWDLSNPDGTHDTAQYYELYRNNQLITSANWSFTNWTDTGPSGGFVPGTHYKYHVVARNCRGPSNPTAQVDGWVAANIQTPATMTATNVGNQVRLTWSAVPDADYHLFIDGSPIIDVDRSLTTYNYNSPCGTHTYCVSAFSCRGTSSQRCTPPHQAPPPAGLPGIPTLVSATPGATACLTNVVLRWNAASAACEYEINVDVNSSFTQPWSSIVDGQVTTVTFPNATAGTQYYWRVRANNPNGIGTWSSTGSWSDGVPVPVLTAPTNGQQVPGPGVTLTWTSCTGLTHDLQVAINSGFSPLLFSSTVSGTSYTWPCPRPGTLYYWRVKACKGGNCSAYSASRTFRVTNPPVGPTLASPADGATVPGPNVMFTWNGVCESGGVLLTAEDDTRKAAPPIVTVQPPYQIQTANNAGFSPTTLDQYTNDTYYTWVSPAAGVYYWRVRRCDGADCTSWSGTRTVTVPLVLVSPVGGENWTTGSTQTVIWQGGGTVKIELFADVTNVGTSLTGPSQVLNAAATGGSASVNLPPELESTRARIQISRTTGAPLYAFSQAPFTIATPLAPNVWSFDNVDAQGHGWNQSDMCQNNGSGVHAVWLDLTTEDLKLASKVDKTADWVVSTIDAVDRVGSWPSIVRGPNDELHVAYYDHNVGTAKLYYKKRTNGVWGNRELVANVQVVQGDCSIVLDNGGVPVIAYDTGNLAGQDVKIVRRNPTTGVWEAFGNVPGGTVGVLVTNFGHHITLRAAANNQFWLAWLDLSGNPFLYIYNGYNWLAYNSYVQWAPGPYTDLSLALTPYHPYYPQLAYAAAGSAPGSQKLYFNYWAQDGSGNMIQRLIDGSLGTISSVDLEFGYQYWDVAIAYTGNGVAKLATGSYSDVEWPNAWAHGSVDATGNMDTQISLVYNPGNGEKWLFYRNAATTSMRAARPYWVDTVPPAASPFLNPSGGCDSIFVSWLATGDNGNSGLATSYDLRWSGSAITTDAAFNGASAVPVALPIPHASGTEERVAIYTGNCGPHYYFGLKIRDDAGNLSPLTGDSYGAQTACVHPPVQCWDAKPGEPVADAMPARTDIVSLKPNPTTSAVDVGIALAMSEKAVPLDLSVFDVAGRRVATLRNANPGVGRHVMHWDARDNAGRSVSAGIYFIRLKAGAKTITKRVVVVR